VGNLNLLLGDEELRKSFEKFGRVDSCRVILNRGFGFVTFEDNVAALAALSVMQNVEILNQRVYCTWGRPKDQPQDTFEEVTGRGILGRKEEDLEDYNSSMMPLLSGLKRVREEPQADKKSRKEWLEEALEKSIITPLSGTAAEIQKEKNAIYIRKRMLEFIDEIKL
jgi:RNA recognition motif-containing protein